MTQITTILVFDTETTGFDPAEHSVCELAVVPVTLSPPVVNHIGICYDEKCRWTVQPGVSSLVNPGRSIPPEASAVHHLVDQDVKDAPTLEDAINILVVKLNLVGGGDLNLAAHNAAFDRSFLPLWQTERCKWVCTWRVSLHLYPDAPSFSNQTLKYFLGLPQPSFKEPLGRGIYPHSALYDTYTTAAVLVRMLQDHTPEELLALTVKPAILRTCRFGKHQGVLWKDVPREYMRWILGRGGKPDGFDEDTRATCEFYLNGG